MIKTFKGIDLFCGGGGTTAGIKMVPSCYITHAINHSPSAIKIHKFNHPEIIHLEEDVRKVVINKLGTTNFLWISAECIHFTRISGGDSKDDSSRSLPMVAIPYALVTKPAYIIVENVEEFLTWGPLIKSINKKGEEVFIPDKNKKSELYNQWINKLKEIGYVNYEYRILNAADYGAFTSRKRYIGIFSLYGYPIKWPEKTHDQFGANNLPKWKSCKEKIDFNNEGPSLFSKKRCKNTLDRINVGVKEYVDKNIEFDIFSFNMKSYSLDDIYCKKHFISKYYNSNGKPWLNNQSIDIPLSTISTNPKHNLITVYLDKHKNILDIKSRSLNSIELKTISGFEDNYVLPGTETEKIHAIGNAVPPPLAKAIIEPLKNEFLKISNITKLKFAS